MTTEPPEQRPIARDNHYVPQTLLRRWSRDGRTVFAYRLLVPDSRVPEWQQVSIRSIASQRDLYTSLLNGMETDAFERWLSNDFEAPASEAIDRLIAGLRLRREDWRSLVRLFALQDLRTPTRFMEQMERWQKDMPGLLESTIKESLQRYEQARGHNSIPSMHTPPTPLADSFKLYIERSQDSGPDSARIHAEVTLGRKLWLTVIQHLLSGRPLEVLLQHKWSVAEPGDGGEWPLTDHPALKLNYRGPGHYDFGGGWGRRRADLMMPLSPRHLLFVEVGRDAGRHVKFSPEHTRLCRRLLIERAHRWVFATERSPSLASIRPRIVDAHAFAGEVELWSRWHSDQVEAETALR